MITQLEIHTTGKVEILAEDGITTDSGREHQSCRDGRGQEIPCALGHGTGHCQCSVCKRFFWSVTAFDTHQRLESGRVICLDPLEIVDRNGNPKPMVKNARGWWVTALDPRAYPRDGVSSDTP